MADEKQIKEAAKKIILQKKNIDGLLNIAGITHNAFFHMTTIETFRKVFEINVFGQILLTQMITRSMLLNKKGSVEEGIALFKRKAKELVDENGNFRSGVESEISELCFAIRMNI